MVGRLPGRGVGAAQRLENQFPRFALPYPRPGRTCPFFRPLCSPLTKVKLINELNEHEVQLGVADNVSWHSEHKDSAWIFLGEGQCSSFSCDLLANIGEFLSFILPDIHHPLVFLSAVCP